MKILIKNARIIDKYSPYGGQTKSILIENGIIAKISDTIDDEADLILSQPGLKVSQGWFDMRVSTGDPGHEHIEDLISVRKAAAEGGFTEIAILPNTKPVVQTKEGLVYQKTKGALSAVTVHPIAAVTIDTKGEDLTEMIDLHHAGAVGFSDGKPLQNSDMVLKVLQYLQPFNGLFINQPEDTLLTKFGVMNEGLNATLLGLKGMPKMAESMMIMRDLTLLKYTGGKIHFSCISTRGAVELIAKAKAEGIQVTCDIAAHQIAFDDSVLQEFDPRYKVNPPFRDAGDIKALWDGLKDGTIDVIVSDHRPHDEESKKLEFDMAEFGAIGLETAFAIVNSHNNIIDLAEIIEKITSRPRQILNLYMPKIEPGSPANLTIFNDNIEWVYEGHDIVSKAKNSPFIGHILKGKALGIINNGIWHTCRSEGN